MPPEIIECEQGSASWHAARAGTATASRFKDILAKGEGKTRRTYMLRLAGERLTGEVVDGYTNAAMERGNEMEVAARSKYAFMHSVEPQLVGFIRNGDVGCSPDALIDANGGLELKSAEPHILIDLLLRNEFPPTHKAQVQGNLWVAEREWWDLAIYWPKLPLFTVRATRDVKFISDLASEVARFNEELAGVVEKVKAYGGIAESPKSMFERSLADA